MLNLSFNKFSLAAVAVDGSHATAMMSGTRVSQFVALGLLVAGLAAFPAQADAEQVARPADTVTGRTMAERYCANIGDAAQDARFAWQAKTISDMEKELDKRIAAIEEKSAELKDWVEKREKFLDMANDGLVEIYTKMCADAAALQLAEMNEVTAAAIVMKLPPKIAGAVLSEMEAEKAARMTATIAGAGRAAKRNKGGES